MTHILTGNFSRLDAKTKSLFQRMARFDLDDRLEIMASEFSKPVFVTRLSLADQVLLHALVKNKIDADLVPEKKTAKQSPVYSSLIDITREQYGLQFSETAAETADVLLTTASKPFIERSRKGKLPQVNPLADWSVEQLVDYVLAHEVPVNPHDMPGHASRAA